MTNTPLSILRDYYGYDAFRGQQEDVINHVVKGGNAFVLMPTGAGKSLCYQIPALCRKGVAVVVSPLIALMQDQINALDQMNIKSAAINSTMTFEEVSAVRRQVREGTIDLLYVAPERLMMPDFLSFLDKCNIALFAIDEAHCVSEWGHDFRPDYAALSMLAERFPNVPRVALTATADAQTRADIVHRLALDDGRSFIGGFDRPNINYSIALRNSPRNQVLRFLKDKHPEDCGIIYCLSRKNVEEMAAWLCEQGIEALPYHAGLSSEVRAQNQQAFLQGERVIMVATIAFGMGIDKPDVRFVVHMNTPKNIEAYYQETGRAGRDGLPSNALMLYGLEDAAQQRQWIEASTAPQAQKHIQHQKLGALFGLCETAKCRRQVLLNYFDDHCEPCGNCDTCEQPPETFDASIPAQKAISCVYRTGERFGIAYLVDVLLGTENDRITQFGHDQLPTFGVGQDLTKPEWQNVFRQLIASNLLCLNPEGQGGFMITRAGRKFLNEKPALPMRHYVKPLRNKRKAGSGLATSAPLNTEDQTLLNTLRSVRSELAKTNKVPAYVIFHDRTLVELAQAKPTNLDAMLEINGIGKSKLDRYGQVFLDAIANEASSA
ncbi:DNA helicase RecQ [Maritalea mediterranea]|uniref:DNA helicase RecQ n=1 Tax=Maritalea mediterranea TaxID=2909667 RepID=A0ABS9E845_9HYPH|nr:DNA helicase RecQ [Maritalea mediterranea]MCF4099041.1 DNA helicase RecQ [Maritalea mediterranea]